MTKLSWFRLCFFVFIFIFLIGICVLEDRLVSNALCSVKECCYEIECVAEKNDTIVSGEVASLVDNLEYKWKIEEEKLCYVVNHKSIEQIGIEIVRLRTYIDEEEPVEFFTSLEIIKSYAESFQHFMGSSVQNFL